MHPRSTATLRPGHWRLDEARVYAPGQPPRERDQYVLDTNLTPEQVRETFSTPETVPFWQLPYFIGMAERAGLSATLELLTLGMAVVGLDAGPAVGGASGRNAGFLLAGSPAFYHRLAAARGQVA